MAARIRSLRNAASPIDEASRDDLVPGDVVTVSSIDAATTYNWSIVFAPQDLAGNPSAATFSGSPTAVSPGSFTVDHEGAYLIRLIVDAGLPTEDTQYVRLRALTTTLGLTLVSAGERRDGSGTIPVDVSIEGWANEQNYNLQALESRLTGGGGGAGVPVGSPLVYHLNLPDNPNDTLEYRGWVPYGSVLVSVYAYMGTVNNQGSYTLDVVNTATGNSCLSGGTPFDMNGLVADTVTAVPTKAAGDADLAFAAQGRWTILLVSDDIAMNGQDIYIELTFGVV